jgi:hypothetical protein
MFHSISQGGIERVFALAIPPSAVQKIKSKGMRGSRSNADTNNENRGAD